MSDMQKPLRAISDIKTSYEAGDIHQKAVTSEGDLVSRASWAAGLKHLFKWIRFTAEHAMSGDKGKEALKTEKYIKRLEDTFEIYSKSISEKPSQVPSKNKAQQIDNTGIQNSLRDLKKQDSREYEKIKSATTFFNTAITEREGVSKGALTMAHQLGEAFKAVDQENPVRPSSVATGRRDGKGSFVPSSAARAAPAAPRTTPPTQQPAARGAPAAAQASPTPVRQPPAAAPQPSPQATPAATPGTRKSPLTTPQPSSRAAAASTMTPEALAARIAANQKTVKNIVENPSRLTAFLKLERREQDQIDTRGGLSKTQIAAANSLTTSDLKAYTKSSLSTAQRATLAKEPEAMLAELRAKHLQNCLGQFVDRG